MTPAVTAPCFYLDRDDLGVGEVVLADGEGHHAVTVKRLRVGEPVLISNGKGRLASGVVAAVTGRDRLAVRIDSCRPTPASVPKLTVALALIKGERMESAIEQLSEVGVDRVVVYAAERSISRSPGGVGEALLSKLRRRSLEAMKQSRRAWLMPVDPVRDTAALGELAARASHVDGLTSRPTAHTAAPTAGSSGHATAHSTAMFVLDVDADKALVGPEMLSDLGPARSAEASEIVVVVGPEGGLTPAELERFAAVGATQVRLGDTVMRAGTAAVAGAVAVSLAVGRWQTAVS